MTPRLKEVGAVRNVLLLGLRKSVPPGAELVRVDDIAHRPNIALNR